MGLVKTSPSARNHLQKSSSFFRLCVCTISQFQLHPAITAAGPGMGVMCFVS